MLRTVLSERQAELLREERHLLEELRLVLAGFEVKPEDMATLGRSLLQLDELFLLVVVGEFNSGKSAFINALLGQPFLAEGVTPTTTHVNVLRYGERAGQEPAEEFVLSLTCPVDFLREINIVDTPGTNAIIRRHQEITEDFVPRSDLVLFITSADRPFTESERAFLERIRQWGKKVVVVLNKIDLFEDEAQLTQVLDFISENVEGLVGFVPEVFPVSARQALRAKTSGGGDERERLWAASRFEPLERYILDTLDEESRVRLKLLNPLGVAQRLTADYLQLANTRLGLLREDLATIDNVESQLDVYRQDMGREFRFRLSDIENLLYEMRERGLAFFDETLRLARIFDLINADRIRGAFEREVVADTPQRIEAAVQELIDWMVDKDLRQWQAVMDYLNERRSAQHEGKIIGQVGGPFEYNRRALLDSVGRAAQAVVAGYDKEAEAKELAESVRMATALTASVSAGAVGLGTILVILLHGVVADFTGILAASALATLGLFVIPSRRRRARNELRDKIEAMRTRLMAGMTTQFERELERSLHRLGEAIAPYTRFIRTEREKLERVRADLEEVDGGVKLLRAKVGGERT